MTKPAAHPDDRRSEILEAARRLLIKRGYQDFVLDDLAKEAGVAKGTLFLYFKSKDELLASTFAELVDRLGQELETIAKSPLKGRAALEATVCSILAHFDRNSDFLSQFGAGRFPSCSDKSCGRLMDKFSANVRRLAALLERSREPGDARLQDVEASAMFLFGICRSMFLYKHLTGRDKSLDERTRLVMDQYLFGAQGRRHA